MNAPVPDRKQNHLNQVVEFKWDVPLLTKHLVRQPADFSAGILLELSESPPLAEPFDSLPDEAFSHDLPLLRASRCPARLRAIAGPR